MNNTNVWFEIKAGSAYKITFPDGRVYLYKDNGMQDILKDFEGVDIVNTKIVEILFDDFSQSGWVD